MTKPSLIETAVGIGMLGLTLGIANKALKTISKRNKYKHKGIMRF